jgi:hypothetical protein
MWYIKYSTRSAEGINWGSSDDQPVPGDYDADGKTDIAAYVPSTSMWYIKYSTRPAEGINWGFGDDLPMPKR